MSAAGVPLAEWHGKDPRLSGPQERALADLVCVDEHASILGFDWAYLPVVEAHLGMPARVRRFAVARDGSPAVVNYGSHVERIAPRGDGAEHKGGSLLETWAA